MQVNVQVDKNKQIDKAMDKIRTKYGSEIITVASLVKKEKAWYSLAVSVHSYPHYNKRNHNS